jgi:hypothetical protein
MMTTSYTVDAEDRITEVGAEWDRFAVENDGAAACAAFVVGQPLFQSIEGDPARMFMQAIFQRVRVGGDSASLRYRCDAPRARRHFLMTVTALPEKALRIDHELEREEIMARRVDFRMAGPGETAILRCSVCCRQEWNGAWVDPFEAAQDSDNRVVHTVCPDCKTRSFRRPQPDAPRDIHIGSA